MGGLHLAAAGGVLQQPPPLQEQAWLSEQAPPEQHTQACEAEQPRRGAADPCLDLPEGGATSRGVGALVAAMAGNALGAQCEPEKHYRLSRLFTNGPDMAWSFDLSPHRLPPGSVTGDFVTLLAVAKSLVRSQGASLPDITDCLAACSAPPGGPASRYSPYTQLTLEALAAGSNPFLLAHHCESLMVTAASRASQSCSHRPDRQMHGPTDFTALVRAVPIGIAYREAPLDVLTQAVDAAVAFSHPTELGRDGAVVIAAAVAWLSRADPAVATPQQLLQHLAAAAPGGPGSDMGAKLALLAARLAEMPPGGVGVGSWRAFWAGEEWGALTRVASLLMKQGLAVHGTQAAALALWVLCASWAQPRRAVELAAALGGYAGTTGALVGGLAGALHGSAWVPAEWWAQLQSQLGPVPGMAEALAAWQQAQHAQREGAAAGASEGAAATAAGAAEAAAARGGGGSGDPAAELLDAAARELAGGEADWLSVSAWDVAQLGRELSQLSCQAAEPLA